MPNVLEPPAVLGAKGKPGHLPAQTWAVTPQNRLLAPPQLGASAVAPQPQPQGAQPPAAPGQPKFNTDRENQIRAELGQSKNPDPPELEKVPKAPPEQQSDPFGGIAPVMMVLAGLAAGKTLSPATTMLNSFAEFNKARVAGDNERMKNAHQAWKDSAQQVVDTNKDRLTTYREVLNANKGDQRALEAELTSLISEDKLYAAMQKDKGGSIYSNVNDWADSNTKATEKLEQQLGEMNEKERIEGELAKIKPEFRNLVKAVGEGKMLPSEVGRGKTREAVMQAVTNVYGESYDSGKIAQRRKYLTSFASPAAVRTEQVLNSTIGHLSDLNDIVNKMSTSDIQKFNSMSQDAIKQLGKGSIYYQFNANRNLLMEEAAKLYKGGTPAQAEIESLKSEMFSAMSQEQMKAVLGQMARNLEDAGDAIGEVRARRGGESEEDASPYTDTTKKRFDKVFKDTGVEGHHEVSEAPKVNDVIEGYRFKGGDPADEKNWEKQ